MIRLSDSPHFVSDPSGLLINRHATRVMVGIEKREPGDKKIKVISWRDKIDSHVYFRVPNDCQR